jgi:hypothetical protein
MKIKKITKKQLKKLEKRERNKQDKIWRSLVLARDGNKCVICGSEKFLNAHHLIPRECKPLRHYVPNGITICSLHHKWSLEISPHRNPLYFYDWFIRNRKEQFEDVLLKYRQYLTIVRFK